jgi:hypothetical protein
LLIDTMGSRVLIVSSALSLAALLALCLLRQDAKDGGQARRPYPGQPEH